MSARRRTGLTLVELLLALALSAALGLLASRGWSRWQQRVARDQACLRLQQLALREQQWMAWYGRYTAQPQQLGCAPDGCVSGAPAAPRYRIGIALDDAGFTLRAVPLHAQRTDACGSLVLDQAGAGSRCCAAALH